MVLVSSFRFQRSEGSVTVVHTVRIQGTCSRIAYKCIHYCLQMHGQTEAFNFNLICIKMIQELIEVAKRKKKDRQTDRERQRQREIQRERQTTRQRETDTDTDRQTDRQTEREREVGDSGEG